MNISFFFNFNRVYKRRAQSLYWYTKYILPVRGLPVVLHLGPVLQVLQIVVIVLHIQSINKIYILQHASQEIDYIVIQAYPNVSTRGTENSPQTLISIHYIFLTWYRPEAEIYNIYQFGWLYLMIKVWSVREKWKGV